MMNENGTEIIELSSDSDKTLCPEDDEFADHSKEKNMYELDFSDEESQSVSNKIRIGNSPLASADVIKRLHSKYIPSGKERINECSASSGSSSNFLTSASIDLTDDSPDGSNEAMQTEFETNLRKRPLDTVLSPSSDEDPDIEERLKNRNIETGMKFEQTKVKKFSKNVSEAKQNAQNARAKILLQRAEKKRQLEKEKALKTATRKIQKSTQPEECLKNIMVMIDQDILQREYGDAIKDNLKNHQLSFKSVPKSDRLISWRRKVQTLTNMMCQETEKEERHYLTIISVKEFDKLTKTHSLRNYIQSIKSNFNFQHLTVVIFGKDKPNEGQEIAMIEINMFFKCNFQFAKKSEDLAFIVTMTTKSVAKIPHKLEKEEKYELQNEYFNDCNKDSVRVDKDGNGLGRLWHQMLTMFPLARLETAEAITAVYPTPTSLFKAYEDASVKGEELIQNLPIRRAQGPLASVRRIGPELSKKCHHFFTSQNNILL